MKKTASVLLLFSIAASAFAADKGFYIGANVGQARTNTYNLSSKFDIAATGLVGYQFNKNVAVEAQYSHLGSITATGGGSAKIAGYGAAVVGILPIYEGWSGYGKLGFDSMSLKISDTGHTANRIAATWGIGGQYQVNEALGIRFGFDSYGIGDSTTQTATTLVVSAGVVYKF
jgi:hypothetical protein